MLSGHMLLLKLNDKSLPCIFLIVGVFMQEDHFLVIGKSEIILLVLGQLLPLPVFHLSVDIQYTQGQVTHLKTCKDTLQDHKI